MKYTFFILLLIPFFSYCQDNTFFIGDKTYSCTANTCIQPLSMGCKIFVSFAKDDNKGLVIFESIVDAAFSNPSGCIISTCLFYLDDNSIIKLYDKSKRDKVNSVCTSVYYLTAEEIIRLKTINIRAIRYNLNEFGGTNAYNFENTSRIDRNRFDYSSTVIPRIDFPIIISNLFGE